MAVSRTARPIDVVHQGAGRAAHLERRAGRPRATRSQIAPLASFQLATTSGLGRIGGSLASSSIWRRSHRCASARCLLGLADEHLVHRAGGDRLAGVGERRGHGALQGVVPDALRDAGVDRGDRDLVADPRAAGHLSGAGEGAGHGQRVVVRDEGSLSRIRPWLSEARMPRPFQRGRGRDALGVARHQEQAEPVEALDVRAAGGDQVVVGGAGQAAERLLAVEQPAALGPGRGGADQHVGVAGLDRLAGEVGQITFCRGPSGAAPSRRRRARPAASSSVYSPASIAASGSRPREDAEQWKKKASAVEPQTVPRAYVVAARSRRPPPRPPYSSGTTRPSRPASPSSLTWPSGRAHRSRPRPRPPRRSIGSTDSTRRGARALGVGQVGEELLGGQRRRRAVGGC